MEGSAIAAVVVLVLVSLILMALGYKKYIKNQHQTQADIEKQPKLPDLPNDDISKVSASTIPPVLNDQNQSQATAPADQHPKPANLDRVAQEVVSLPKGAESPMMGRKRAPTLQKNTNPNSAVNLADPSNSTSATDAKIQQVIGSVRVRSSSFKKKEGEVPVFKAPEI